MFFARRYLTLKIEEGNVSELMCPQTDCSAVLPSETVAGLVSEETGRRFLHFHIGAFVDTNPELKWCPEPGCGRAVRNPRLFESDLIHRKVIVAGLHEQHNVISEFSASVDCGHGHEFCWECLQESHEPATCHNWRQWFDKVRLLKPETRK